MLQSITQSAFVFRPRTHAAVRDAMARLPEDYREVIRLRQDEQMTIRETAERMGRSPDAVKMLYGRALERLSDLLGLSEEET